MSILSQFIKRIVIKPVLRKAIDTTREDTNITKKLDQDILTKYIESCIKHGAATLKGDGKLANKAYDEINIIGNKILNQDPSVLLHLLKHENSSVRLWTATILLKYFPKPALKVLKKLQKENSILGFNAKHTIIEWQNGKLRNFEKSDINQNKLENL